MLLLYVGLGWLLGFLTCVAAVELYSRKVVSLARQTGITATIPSVTVAKTIAHAKKTEEKVRKVYDPDTGASLPVPVDL